MSDAPTMQIEEVPDASASASASASDPSLLQKLGGSIGLLFVLTWALSGIAALIMSIVCFGFSGTMTEKVVGLAIAFFLGPLYFIFYAVNKDYCKSMNSTVVTAVNRVMG